MKRSKLEELFLQLCKEKPDIVLKALSDRELTKPLLLKDHISQGGKLGTRGLASKYSINRSSVQRFLKQKQQQDDTNNCA